MAARVILVEAYPRDPVTGAIVPVRLAGGGAALPYHYGGQHWRAGVAELPRSIAKLDFDGLQLGGGGVPEALEITWAPARSADLAGLSRLYWTDAAITVRIGPEGAMPPIDTAGLVLDTPVQDGALTIALADLAVDLKRPLLVDRYAGTGGVEGPADWKDQIKPRCWGRCWNVPGRPINAAANIWCFGDPARSWHWIDQVRDKGVPASSVVVVDWQGSIAATFAALVARAVPAGGCGIAPAIACAKWWTAPAGELRADVRGEYGGDYVETAPEIAARLVAARSTLTFAPGAVAAAAAARPVPFGWRCDNEGTTVAAAISEILGDVSLSWVIVDGAIDFRPWTWSAPVRSARSLDVRRRKLIKPVTTRKLGYRKNQAPMARGDLADIVFARDVVIDDGTTVADLSDRVADLGSDNVLTKGREKRELVREWRALKDRADAVEAQYVAVGSPVDVAPARTAAGDAVAALWAALVALAPAWDDVGQDTPVDGAALNTLWISARQKVETFSSTLTGRSIALTPASTAIRYYANGTLVPGQSVTFRATRRNTAAPTIWYVMNHAGATVFSGAASAFVGLGLGQWESSEPDVLSITAQGIADFMGTHGGVVGRLSVGVAIEGDGIGAVASLTAVRDGAKGDQGDQGDAGDPGEKGDQGDPGAKGDPLFGFVQDEDPGPGEHEQQTWYRPTTKQLFVWVEGEWRRMFGELASLSIITEAARIGNAVINSAHIGSLQVKSAHIDQLTVGSDKIMYGGSGEVSLFYDAVSAVDVTTSTVWIEIGSVAITPAEGQPLHGTYTAILRDTTGSETQTFVRVIRDDGTPVWGGSAGFLVAGRDEGESLCIVFFDSVSAGRPTTYKVQAKKRTGATDNIRVEGRSFLVREMTREHFQNIEIHADSNEGPGRGDGGGGNVNGYGYGLGFYY